MSRKGPSMGVAATAGATAGAGATSAHLMDLPNDFEPTTEESNLRQMYASIQALEREATRLREKKARDKIFANGPLAAAEGSGTTEINSHDDDDLEEPVGPPQDDRDGGAAVAATATGNGASSTKKHRAGRKKKKRNVHGHQRDKDEDDSDVDSIGNNDDDDHDDDDVDAEDTKQDLADRRAAKLEALRDEVEGKKHALQEKTKTEEELRQQLLETNDDSIMEDGPVLKKRKRATADEAADGPSLLENMVPIKTPPHEFSSNLGIKSWQGTVVFPVSPDDDPTWTPPQEASSPNDGAFLAYLPDFDIAKASNGQGNNTLAIKFTAPVDSKRFSINIATPNNSDFDSVLFHFNPRQRGRGGGQLVLNDKQTGVWGRAVALPLSQIPIIFGQTSITLIIQINGDGFDVFIEGKHCARLEHRTELPSKPCSLALQFPSCDDALKPENWTVYKAWWGNKESMVKENELAGVAGYKTYNSVHPRKLFISGLPRIRTDREVEYRRAELERHFRQYGGARGVSTVIPTNSTFAFVEFETDRSSEQALQELSGKLPYKINRARRSKHEALMDERAQAEAAAQGKTKSTGDW